MNLEIFSLTEKLSGSMRVFSLKILNKQTKTQGYVLAQG